MSGDGYFRVEMSRKFCEDEMKEYSGLRPAIWPYWQYIENHWSDIQVSKRWRYTPLHPVYTLAELCAQINLAWLELTFHKKKVWDHEIFRFCWPFQLELLPPQWMLDVFLWLFSHGPGFNHCNAFGNKKQCQYF